ncbi:MAG: hypothetical protein AAGH38_08670 [Pseudomonadota bacterium]
MPCNVGELVGLGFGTGVGAGLEPTGGGGAGVDTGGGLEGGAAELSPPESVHPTNATKHRTSTTRIYFTS